MVSRSRHPIPAHDTALRRTGGDPSVPLELLCWLLEMCGAVLADDGAGEDPLPPVALAAALEAGLEPNAAGVDPVVQLSSTLLQVATACLELTTSHPGSISPRLMEVLVATLGRWADTYLMAEEGIVPSLDVQYGTQGGGPGVADLLVRMALAAIQHFPGEARLHKVGGASKGGHLWTNRTGRGMMAAWCR